MGYVSIVLHLLLIPSWHGPGPGPGTAHQRKDSEGAEAWFDYIIVYMCIYMDAHETYVYYCVPIYTLPNTYTVNIYRYIERERDCNTGVYEYICVYIRYTYIFELRDRERARARARLFHNHFISCIAYYVDNYNMSTVPHASNMIGI